MYLFHKTTDEADFTQSPPFGPGFSQDQADKGTAMEVWCSSFKDPGPDYTVFKLIAADGRIVAEKRVEGY